jgi:hypothetical protein
MMLAVLLARQGLDVVVLEKHPDFLRDFRGDTVHPSTLELVSELGWLDEFLQLPHTTMSHVTVDTDDGPVTFADFRRVPARCRYIAFMPQWDFLDFLADKAGRYPGFRLLRRAEVTDLVEESGRVVGVRARTPDGPVEIRAARRPEHPRPAPCPAQAPATHPHHAGIPDPRSAGPVPEESRQRPVPARAAACFPSVPACPSVAVPDRSFHRHRHPPRTHPPTVWLIGPPTASKHRSGGPWGACHGTCTGIGRAPLPAPT